MRSSFLAVGLTTVLAQLGATQASPTAGGVQDTVLSNGLRVIVAEDHSVPLATVLVAVRNGAFTQGSKDAGLAHLYEHMLFRGYEGNQAAFAYEAAELQAVYNGTTTQEGVTYYMIVPSKNAKGAIRQLGGLMSEARLTRMSLQAERPVVLDEIQRAASDPEQALQREVEEKLWGEAWPQKDALGTEEALEKITLSRLLDTFRRFYIPNNAALIVTGDVSTRDAFQVARRAFGKWQAGPDPFPKGSLAPIPPLTRNTAVMLGLDVSTVTILIELQGPSVGEDPGATYAADVLFDVLNDPGSAFQRRMVAQGPFRSLRASYLTLNHVGPISFRGVTTPADAREALLALLAELDQLDQLEGVSAEDLEIAKKRREVRMALTREATASLARELAFWWSSTGLAYYRTYHARLNTQTTVDLSRFAKEYVVSRPKVIGVLSSPKVTAVLSQWIEGRTP